MQMECLRKQMLSENRANSAWLLLKVMGAAGDDEALEFGAGLSKVLCNILRGLVYSLEPLGNYQSVLG